MSAEPQEQIAGPMQVDSAPRARREAWIAAAAGALLALPSLLAYFVADDFVSLHSVTVTPPWRFLWSNWLGAVGEGGFYRPVFNWALGLCYLAGGLDPMPFRLLIIGVYAGNCALVVQLAARATGSSAGALAAGLFFAAHPAHHESIGWISSILEQLCAMFFLLSIAAFDRAARLDRGRRASRWLAVSVGMMALSLGSKEVGIMIPAVAALWDLCVLRASWGGPAWRRIWRRIRLWAPLAVLGLIYLGFRVLILGGLGGYGERHLRFGVIDNHLVHYLHFLLEPLPAPWLDRGAGGKALTVLAAGLLGLWALARTAGLPRWRGAALGLGWFFLSWLPASTLLRPQYLFQPSVGAAIVVGAVMGSLLDEARRRAQPGLAAALSFVSLLWLLHAGGALLSHLKLWEAGGQIAESVLRQSRELLREAPPRSVLLYEKLPVNIGVPVFQHGIAEALRLYLGREDIDALRLSAFGDLPRFVDPWRARFLSYDKGTLIDRTVEVRVGSGLAPQ
jgi:hypothetical protein